MDFFQEVLVLSDAEQNKISCSVYDFKSLSLLTTFKGDSSARKGLAFVGEDYIISALDKQPSLKVWTLCEKPEDTSMACPGIVSCLAITNCGSYCIAGINSSIFLWETSSGDLLANLKDFHRKNITCLRFSSEGSHFLSGGKDGIVFTWLLSNVIDVIIESDEIRPRFQWVDHSAEVTDIYVGDIGFYSHVATASKDMSCRIYELSTGILLATVHVDYAITALTRDSCGHFLILGSFEGDIYRINMFSAEDTELHYGKTEIKSAFLGHSKEITCLSLSMSGKLLVSGSEDGDCRVWDMTNFSCVNRITCAGAVTNAFVTLMPPGLNVEQRFYPKIHFSTFKRLMKHDREGTVTSKIQPKNLSLFHLGSPDEYFDSRILLNSPASTSALNEPNISIKYVKDVNNANTQLFAYGLKDTIFSIKANGKSNVNLIIDEEEHNDV